MNLFLLLQHFSPSFRCFSGSLIFFLKSYPPPGSSIVCRSHGKYLSEFRCRFSKPVEEKLGNYTTFPRPE
ncbi:MAG: hypothetical protein DRG82_16435 [Deltaproteobacteria bacterium]|nr:MAG: hypothetical protein DRG82_16435 [Deltaproteobacteria bacterium]